ncbi:hypothetical protein V5799_005941 [Amblyomma americanum]|uniref:Uncharacterized protein n=1 Tax=Amblyomma americanum TaxID=6943 RepID=A0AAQ4DXU2_AMBAM
MAASNYSPSPPAPSVSRNTDSADAPRRRREETVYTWACSPTELLEEARERGQSRYDTAIAVKDRMYRLLYVVLGFTVVILTAGIASIVLDWHRGLGVALVLTGTALVIACWAVFLCSCSERSRMFIAVIVPSYFLRRAGTAAHRGHVDVGDKLL